MTSLATAAALSATPAPAPQSGGIFGLDPLMIGMLAILAVMVFFMFRNSRKRKAEAERLQSTMVPGVEVMTNYGLYGTLLDVDDVANTAHVEIAPGTIVKVHRQTLAKVVEAGAAGVDGEPRSVEEAMAIAEREQQEREAADRAGADSTAALDEDEAADKPSRLDALGKYAPEADEPKFGERLPKDDGDAADPDAKKSDA